jgi:hypothetical protein
VADDHLSFFDHEIKPNQKKRLKRKTIYKRETRGGAGLVSVMSNFWALCSEEEDLLPEADKARLFCYYENKGVWLLGPLRIEQLAPQVIQIHGALVEKEMEAIKIARKKTCKQ